MLISRKILRMVDMMEHGTSAEKKKDLGRKLLREIGKELMLSRVKGRAEGAKDAIILMHEESDDEQEHDRDG